MAMAAPVRPAMRLWLSLVGIPKMEAPTLYTTIENNAAQSATNAAVEGDLQDGDLVVLDPYSVPVAGMGAGEQDGGLAGGGLDDSAADDGMTADDGAAADAVATESQADAVATDAEPAA